ncbi:MAG: type III PLP-dependent enzyme [Magnetospiraceae bacterium]
MTPKLQKFLSRGDIQAPCLVVDLDVIETNYRRLRSVMPRAEIFYAAKANPAAPILRRLVALGSSFDAASHMEVAECLAAGADPARISYGNTVKKERHIAAAFADGVTLFAFDSLEELEKLGRAAPGARVYCRVLVENEGADWPLSRKFGCSPEMARDLMMRAVDLGLVPHGISFHVGSQQTHADRWEAAIAQVAMIFTDLRDAGLDLKMLNLGGGYPVRYKDPIPPLETYGDAIEAALHRHFGNRIPDIIMEPGRAIVADAGVMLSEVVLVSRKAETETARWVYLDVGMFGGLAETMGEAIRYRFETDRDGDAQGPVVIAGPTCDGADILYENTPYQMPLSLRAGDLVRIPATGAYTTTYAAQNFNGFKPMREYYV